MKNCIIGYDLTGKPIITKEFIDDINLALQQLENGTFEGYTTEEVKRRILDSK